VQRLRRYFQESWSELKKVAWPTRDQVRNLTVLVFIVSAAIGVFIAVWDFVFTTLVRFITPGAA
jgi:preprotein translocase subunit SecE